MPKRRIDASPSLAGITRLAKGLAHPVRLRLLAMLGTGELCVCQMTAVVGLAASTVSQHLAVLARGGLVAERKEGKLVFYRLQEDGTGATLLSILLARLADDPSVRTDREEVARLREIPISTLCAADLDLVSIGVRPAGARATPAAP